MAVENGGSTAYRDCNAPAPSPRKWPAVILALFRREDQERQPIDVNRIALEVLLLDQVIDGSRFSSLFLAVRLVVLPHCVTRQESFVLLCQLAQGGEQLPRLELEARQLPQTRKDKFGWPFHDLVYGRFLMPRCDVKHTTTQPVRSVRVTTQRELAGALDRAVSEASAALLA